MNIGSEMKRASQLILISFALVIVIVGCAVHTSQAAPSEKTVAQIGIVNHTGSYIYSASVNGAGGGNMERWGVGFANICCTSIPRAWHPGMKVLVRWNMPIGTTDVVKEKVVEVETYDLPGSIYMHFFPDDEVQVVVSRFYPGSAEYPIQHLGSPDEKHSSN
jgi:hypothetical protein